MTSTLVDFRLDNGVAWITIKLPEKLNAVSFDVLAALEDAVERAAADDECRVVVITGAGEKAFVAGADISEIAEVGEEDGPDVVRRGQNLYNRIERLGKPVIAAVNGYAMGGGCELALACHIRIASSNALLGLPEVKLGLLPGYGGTQRLVRTIGSGRGLHLMMTGDPLTAEQALDWGLVTQVVELSELESTVSALAGKLARLAPLALQAILDSVIRGRDLPIQDGLDIEAEYFVRLCMSEDKAEGVAAFLEKRKPEFRGR